MTRHAVGETALAAVGERVQVQLGVFVATTVAGENERACCRAWLGAGARGRLGIEGQLFTIGTGRGDAVDLRHVPEARADQRVRRECCAAARRLGPLPGLR
ncbi:MAG: hypothetical protein EBZ91_12855 [Gammaproteobacteria bacterium]|nr:hypothetical protein [Gammaproteobacteria bacterium]